MNPENSFVKRSFLVTGKVTMAIMWMSVVILATSVGVAGMIYAMAHWDSDSPYLAVRGLYASTGCLLATIIITSTTALGLISLYFSFGYLDWSGGGKEPTFKRLKELLSF